MNDPFHCRPIQSCQNSGKAESGSCILKIHMRKRNTGPICVAERITRHERHRQTSAVRMLLVEVTMFANDSETVCGEISLQGKISLRRKMISHQPVCLKSLVSIRDVASSCCRNHKGRGAPCPLVGLLP